eukprot:scaffold6705_cov31-Tisochrysis_lutea.AAC.9
MARPCAAGWTKTRPSSVIRAAGKGGEAGECMIEGTAKDDVDWPQLGCGGMAGGDASRTGIVSASAASTTTSSQFSTQSHARQFGRSGLARQRAHSWLSTAAKTLASLTCSLECERGALLRTICVGIEERARELARCAHKLKVADALRHLVAHAQVRGVDAVHPCYCHQPACGIACAPGTEHI